MMVAAEYARAKARINSSQRTGNTPVRWAPRIAPDVVAITKNKPILTLQIAHYSKGTIARSVVDINDFVARGVRLLATRRHTSMEF